MWSACLRPQALLAVSGGSESSVHVYTAARQRRRPAADIGSQEPPSGLKTLYCAEEALLTSYEEQTATNILYVCFWLMDHLKL